MKANTELNWKTLKDDEPCKYAEVGDYFIQYNTLTPLELTIKTNPIYLTIPDESSRDHVAMEYVNLLKRRNSN